MYTQDQIDTVINGKKPTREEQLFKDLLMAGEIGYVIAIRRNPVRAIRQMQRNAEDALYRLSDPGLSKSFVDSKFEELTHEIIRLESLISKDSKEGKPLTRSRGYKAVREFGFPREPFVYNRPRYFSRLLKKSL